MQELQPLQATLPSSKPFTAVSLFHPVCLSRECSFSLIMCTWPRLVGDFATKGVVCDPLVAWKMRAYLRSETLVIFQ